MFVRPPTRELGAAGASRRFEQRLSSPTRPSYSKGGANAPGGDSNRAMSRARAFLDKIQPPDERVSSPETVRKEPRRLHAGAGVRDSSALSPTSCGLRVASPSHRSMQPSARHILGSPSPIQWAGRPNSRCCHTPQSPEARYARTNFQPANDCLFDFLDGGSPPAESRKFLALMKDGPEIRRKKGVCLDKKSTEEMRSEMIKIFQDAKVLAPHSRMPVLCVWLTATRGISRPNRGDLRA
jgi:hypothetical protein